MPRTAAGIPDRDDRGDHTRLRPGQLISWVVQQHDAARAGAHRDVRLGTPETGLFSWATKKPLPRPGEQVAFHQQPVHAHGYGSFQGEISSGYGKGRVRLEDRGQALVTGVGPDRLEVSLAHRKHPERLQLVRPKGWDGRTWLARNATPRPDQKPPYQKVHYRSVPAERAEAHLAALGPRDVVQPKVDGASLVLGIPKDRRIELFSYRNQVASGLPISHVEKAHGLSGDPRPRLDTLPGHLADSVLRGELYAKDRRGRVLPPQALGALLNSTLANALAKQRARGAGLYAALFDIQRRGGQDISFAATPYAERRRMLAEFLPHLPANYHLADQVEGPSEALKLWRQVTSGRHPLTREGLVLHPEHGRPTKLKADTEADTYITGTFPGKGRRAATIGGLTYATEPGGRTVGRVGSGLTDETLRMIARDPAAFVGRIARIRAQQQMPSGAYRAPRLIALHEG